MNARSCLVRIGQAAVVAGLALGTFGASCSDGSSGSGSSGRGRVDDRSSTSGRGNVPRGAEKVADDRGPIGFTAPYDGRIWVTEGDDNEVIFTQLLYRGEEFRIDPKKNRGYINGREVLKREILGELKHRIFFDRERAARY